MNTLGLSNTVMRLIERRTSQVKIFIVQWKISTDKYLKTSSVKKFKVRGEVRVVRRHTYWGTRLGGMCAMNSLLLWMLGCFHAEYNHFSKCVIHFNLVFRSVCTYYGVTSRVFVLPNVMHSTVSSLACRGISTLGRLTLLARLSNSCSQSNARLGHMLSLSQLDSCCDRNSE